METKNIVWQAELAIENKEYSLWQAESADEPAFCFIYSSACQAVFAAVYGKGACLRSGHTRGVGMLAAIHKKWAC